MTSCGLPGFAQKCLFTTWSTLGDVQESAALTYGMMIGLLLPSATMY